MLARFFNTMLPLIMIIILAVMCIIVITELIFVDEIKKLILKFTNKKNSSNKSDAVKEFEAANPNIPPHILHYTAGQKNSWGLIKIAIYKMYLDGDLLNCESLILGIGKTMESLTDQNLVTKLSHDFDTYMIQVLNPPTPATGIGTGDQNPPPLPPVVNEGN